MNTFPNGDVLFTQFEWAEQQARWTKNYNDLAYDHIRLNQLFIELIKAESVRYILHPDTPPPSTIDEIIRISRRDFDTFNKWKKIVDSYRNRK